MPFFSIVIPVFNRAWSVTRAVESAIKFGAEFGTIEIVLVDDASTDESLTIMRELIAQYGDNERVAIKLVCHEKNKGVCAAKNTGAFAASGEWIVFLDSDDELLPDVANNMKVCILRNETYPLHFFRCIPENEHAPSEKMTSSERRDFAMYFAKGTDGEALPVIKRDVFVKYPYDQDINGYESLSYFRIVRNYGAAILNSLAARRYYTSHETRLSSKAGMARRHRNLAKGHLRVLTEHGRVMTLSHCVRQLARYLKSTFLAQIS
jgi:glycosyltransferase involved in cell wall biosynthesis